jgi:hypothetical protein
MFSGNERFSLAEPGDDSPIGVLKVGAACHIDELLDEGCVFMNTSSYYAALGLYSTLQSERVERTP